MVQFSTTGCHPLRGKSDIGSTVQTEMFTQFTAGIAGLGICMTATVWTDLLSMRLYGTYGGTAL
jgi:hypothetical protein